MSRTYYVYLLASRSRALYVGVTGNLLRRVFEHRTHAVPGHTDRYRITRLVHFESTNDVHGAIAREKQIKGWCRSKKVALIEAVNPTWEHLAADCSSSCRVTSTCHPERSEGSAFSPTGIGTADPSLLGMTGWEMTG